MAQPMTDSAATANRAEAPKTEAKAPTRLILVRHGVTAQTGPLLSGRMPGIDLSEKGVGQAEAAATRLERRSRSPPIYASPIERTTQTAQCIAAHHDLEVQPLPGVIEADYGDWTGGKIADLAKTDEWKVVQAAPFARAVPGRRVDPRDAVTHGRRARRGRGRAPERDRRGRESRRPDQVGDRALHRACTSTCSNGCT